MPRGRTCAAAAARLHRVLSTPAAKARTTVTLESVGHRADSPVISFDDFLRVDIRLGRIVEVRPFPAARKPAYQLEVDFGPEIGRRRSSAQLTHRYQLAELLGRQVLAVVNLPPRQIGTFLSEVLILGVPDENGDVVLIEPATDVPLGGRVF